MRNTKYNKQAKIQFLISVGVIAAYLISWLLNANLLLRVVTAFPLIYLMPGLSLLLLLRKPNDDPLDLKELVVESFFISTVLNVAVVSAFILLDIPLTTSSFVILYVCLVSILTSVNYVLHKPVRVSATKFDYVILCMIGIGYVLITTTFTILPRYFTPDETVYITYARYAVLQSEIYPVSTFLFSPDLSVLFNGRLLWTSLGASFLCSTGSQPYQIYLMNCMFLPMNALVSALLIPSNLKDSRMLQVALVALTLSNPLFVTFSGFILTDLGISFYFLFTTAVFIRSFKTDGAGTFSIDFQKLALSFLSIFVVTLIKPNLVILFAMYLILIVFIFRYKLHKIDRKYKILLYGLIIPVLLYELVVDVPYVIAYWFLKNDPVAMFLHKFLVVSPIEWLLGIFTPLDSTVTSVFFHNYLDYLNYLYRLLSPEVLGLVPASIGLVLPAILLSKDLRSDLKIKVLISFTSVNMCTYYLLYLSHNDLYSVARMSLFIYPMITAVSLVVLYKIFSERNLKIAMLLMVFSLFLLYTQSTISIEEGGVLVGFGLPKLSWTGNIILVQLSIYILLIATRLSMREKFILCANIKLRKMLTLTRALNVSKTCFITLMIVFLSSNAVFSLYSLNNSCFYKEHDLISIRKLLEDKWSEDNWVFSNLYYHASTSVPDSLLSNHYLFSLPMSEREFIQLLTILPNNTLILLSDDRDMAYLEYANKDGYIFKYLKSSKILISKIERYICDGIVLDLRFDAVENGKVTDYSDYQHNVTVSGNASLVQGVYGRALNLDAVGDYVHVLHSPSLNTNHNVTLECWFNSTNNRGFMIQKSIGGQGGYILGFTPGNALLFEIRDKVGGNILYDSVPSSGGHHVVAVCEKIGETQSKLTMYLDGQMCAESTVTRILEMSSNTQDMKLFVNDWFTGTWYNGIGDEVRVYNRALSEEEILKMYYGFEMVGGEGKAKLFQVEGDKERLTGNQSSNINVESVNINWINTTTVKLEIKANSLKNENASVYLDTFDFLKVFEIKLIPGENTFTLDFPRYLPNGYGYGNHIASWANIIIVDSQCNTLYHKVHAPFSLRSSNIGLWSLGILFLLTSLLVLISERGCKHGDIKA